MLRYPDTTRRHPKWARLILLCFALSAAGCGESGITEPDQRLRDAELTLRASVVGTPIATLVVRVSAEDIPLALLYNITVVDGIASATIKIPPGLARLIQVEAFDETGQITHEGSAIVNVNPGSNPPLIIVLVPRPGQLPITVTMAEFYLEVSPNAVHIPQVGEFAQLTAYVFTTDGFPVSATVEWASSNPAIASVDGNGMVTGLAEGTAQVVATYQGVAAYAAVAVGTSDSEFQGLYVGAATVEYEFGNPDMLSAAAAIDCTQANSPCVANLQVSSNGPTSLSYLLIINGNGFLGVTQPDNTGFVFAQNEFVYDDGVVQAQCYVYMNLTLGDADADTVLDATGSAVITCTQLNEDEIFEIVAERYYSISVEK